MGIAIELSMQGGDRAEWCKVVTRDHIKRTLLKGFVQTQSETGTHKIGLGARFRCAVQRRDASVLTGSEARDCSTSEGEAAFTLGSVRL